MRFFDGKHGVQFVLKKYPVAFLTLGLFLLVAFAVTVVGGELRGVGSLVYIFVCPIMLAILIMGENNKNLSFLTTLRNMVLVIAVAQGALGIAQYLTKSAILFDAYYARQYWWSETISRSIGSTDHPIMLSILMCAGIALSVGLSNTALRIFLPLFFLLPVVCTGSRVGLIVAAVLVAWIVLAGPVGWITRIFLLGVLAGAVSLVLNGTIFKGAFGRFEDDSGSTRVRLLAYDLFGDVWPDYFFFGGGATHSYDLLETARLTTSFESAGLTYAVDYGVVPIFLYFLAMTTIAFTRIRSKKKGIPGSAVAFTAVFIQFQSYSGGTVQSSVASLLWLLVALSACSLKSHPKSLPRNNCAQQVAP
ncbi:hypothetical protein [Arthrobacter psychrolactophilus]|uniref:hypothetical protein n=1 Tax=Arthrobacter psychrolactophilus TaxID=92442 RepID=UPI0011B7BC15|nr:hypothetical protein [Arthrobacter psychrolactophilus]